MKILKLIALGFIFPLGMQAQQNSSLEIDNKIDYAILRKHKISIKLDSLRIEIENKEANADAQRSKTISKSFNLDRDDKVNIENRYGSIVVKTWNKPEVKVDVEINVFSNSDSDAQKLIDGVNVNASKSENLVLFKTVIDDSNSSFGTIIKNGIVKKRREMKINYVVYMPIVNPLQLNQVYGNIEIGDFNGPTALKLQYGNLKAGLLNNQNNYINIQYGKCEIQEAGSAVIKHSYGSGLTLGTVGTLDLDASYVNVNVGNIKKSAKIAQEYGSGMHINNVLGNLNVLARYAKVNVGTVKGHTILNSDYGNVTISNLASLSLTTKYANVNIGQLAGDAKLKMNYNGLSINNILQTCKNLLFDGEYVGVNLGFSDQYAGEFIVDTAYGNFKYSNDNVTSTMLKNSSTSKSYKGRIGNSGSNNINIKSRYGSVIFK